MSKKTVEIFLAKRGKKILKFVIFDYTRDEFENTNLFLIFFSRIYQHEINISCSAFSPLP